MGRRIRIVVMTLAYNSEEYFKRALQRARDGQRSRLGGEHIVRDKLLERPVVEKPHNVGNRMFSCTLCGA